MTPANLQHNLNLLDMAASQLGLKINVQKTKIMVFRKGGYLGKNEKWFLNGEQIEIVNNYKYLGYLFTTKLSGDVALTEYVGKAKSKVYTIIRILKALGKLDLKIFFKLFDSQVTSALMYGSEIWGLTPYDVIENVHTFAIKKILGVRKQTPNCLIYGESGRFPLNIESKIRVIKYWYRIINMEQDRLPRLAYCREFEEYTKKQNWARGIKELFESTGFGYIWELGFATQINSVARQLKLRLKDMFIQNWESVCDNSSKFIEYRNMKKVYGYEKYLDYMPISKFRFAFTRMRIAASYLHINRKLIFENAVTKCPFCEKEESEIHFILYCNMYNDLRDKYVKKTLSRS